MYALWIWPGRSSSAGTAAFGSCCSTRLRRRGARRRASCSAATSRPSARRARSSACSGCCSSAGRIHHPVDRQSRALVSQIGVLIVINLAFGFASGGVDRQRRPHRRPGRRPVAGRDRRTHRRADAVVVLAATARGDRIGPARRDVADPRVGRGGRGRGGGGDRDRPGDGRTDGRRRGRPIQQPGSRSRSSIDPAESFAASPPIAKRQDTYPWTLRQTMVRTRRIGGALIPSACVTGARLGAEPPDRIPRAPVSGRKRPRAHVAPDRGCSRPEVQRAGGTVGSTTLTRAPCGATFSAWAVPPCAAASSRTMARPRPLPGPVRAGSAR